MITKTIKLKYLYFTIGLLALLILVLIPVLQSRQTSTAVETNPIRPQATDGWAVYTNKENGFQFDYPKVGGLGQEYDLIEFAPRREEGLMVLLRTDDYGDDVSTDLLQVNVIKSSKGKRVESLKAAYRNRNEFDGQRYWIPIASEVVWADTKATKVVIEESYFGEKRNWATHYIAIHPFNNNYAIELSFFREIGETQKRVIESLRLLQ